MNDKIKLGLSSLDKGILILIPPILGGVIGWYAPIIAGWIVKLPFIPYGQFFEWIATGSNSWVTSLTLCIGVIAGIVFAIYAFSESLNLEIDDKEMKTEVKGKKNVFAKKDIGSIFLDRKQLVFLGRNGEELFREEKPDVKVEVLQETLWRFGYPWKEQDPYKSEYQLWVENFPDFDAHENALLAAREKALEKKEMKKVIDIQKELNVLGIVIYDEDEKQYVRTVKGVK